MDIDMGQIEYNGQIECYYFIIQQFVLVLHCARIFFYVTVRDIGCHTSEHFPSSW
jgi:hypothetical protein